MKQVDFLYYDVVYGTFFTWAWKIYKYTVMSAIIKYLCDLIMILAVCIQPVLCSDILLSKKKLLQFIQTLISPLDKCDNNTSCESIRNSFSVFRFFEVHFKHFGRNIIFTRLIAIY